MNAASYLGGVLRELEAEGITPKDVAHALAKLARDERVRREVAANNERVDAANRERAKLACSICGGPLVDDGHGGICIVCDDLGRSR